MVLINTENNPVEAQKRFRRLKIAYYNYPHPYTIKDHPSEMLELRHSVADLLRAAHYGKLHTYHLSILKTAVNSFILLQEAHDLTS